MRNLKKILSLALALVMVFSLMTFASAKDFNDSADIEYTEAVEVLTALEVIDGVGNNTFNPTGKVTRAQMAKMITLISLGNVSVDAFNGVNVDLTDISGHWAEAYIKYCYSQGIISGKGNGRFDPDANVTTAEAAKMLLVALGYNSDVQVYEGPSWNVNVIRDAQINDIFDDMSGMASDLQINRDQAAQMMYNTLNTGIIEKGSEQSRVDGSISDTYTKNDDKTLLWQSFKGQIWIGTFEGNKDTGNTSVDGEIEVKGRIEGTNVKDESAKFPFDFDISYIGEEVKVIFKDGTSGTKNTPDRNDTIYGVYVTGGTTVYNITKADLKECTKSNKIKFDGTEYETVADVEYVLNYDNDQSGTIKANTPAKNAGIGDNDGTGWRKQSADTIKFIVANTGDDVGKIIKAYVVEQKIGRVTAVTSSKVTISGLGSIDIEDNNVPTGLAKDDVVVYTRLYDNGSDLDDAYFNVALAETVEGELTGYKDEVSGDNHKYINVAVDGKTYKVNKNVKDLNALASITDDAITQPDADDIGNQVRLYLVGGMVGAIQELESSGGNYAMVTDISESGKVGSDLDPVKVVLMLPDGSKQTLNIHKDSTENGSKKFTEETNGGTATEVKGVMPVGTLIEYSSISSGSVKIKGKAETGSAVTATNVWDQTSRVLTYGGGKNDKAVAAANATLFVQSGDDFYAYSMRGLSDIAKERVTSQLVSYYLKDGQVVAAKVTMARKPSGGTDNTLYGIVTSYGQTTTLDGDKYVMFSVAVGRDENVTVYVDGDRYSDVSGYIKKGWIVTFDETSDGTYDKEDFVGLTGGHITGPEKAEWFAAASKDYSESERLLRYYTSTYEDGAIYTGNGETSITTTSDVKIIYVDGDDDKAGNETGISGFDPSTGKADILVHRNDDGIADVIIVETSGKESLAANFSNADNFASPSQVVVVPENPTVDDVQNAIDNADKSTPVNVTDPLTENKALDVKGKDVNLKGQYTNTQATSLKGGTLTLGGGTEEHPNSMGAVNLGTGAERGGTVKVESETTITGAITGEGTVEVAEGTKLTISGTQDIKANNVTFSGKGEIEINGDITCDPGDFAEQMGESHSVEKDGTTKVYTVKVSADVPKLSGTGNVKGYDVPLNTELAKTPKAKYGQFYNVTVDPELWTKGSSYFQVQRQINGVWDNAIGGLGAGTYQESGDTFFLDIFWPNTVTAYRIFISDTSGCPDSDTDRITINVTR